MNVLAIYQRHFKNHNFLNSAFNGINNLMKQHVAVDIKNKHTVYKRMIIDILLSSIPVL